MDGRRRMKTFLLLHGSWHGAWCWYKITPRLEATGHRVIVPDLPGRGRSPARPMFIGLKQMVAAVVKALPDAGKVTLVVHSRNGIVASSVAEAVPDRVERVIYLASFMLPSGKRVLDYLPDRGALLTGHVTVNRRALWDWLDPAQYEPALYADCSMDDVALTRALLVREPVRPALTRLKLTEGCYSRVPRAYIRLTADKAVSIELQDQLLAETPVEAVETIDASHSAYFSKPDELTAAILRLAMP
jgi:pimeloyl-ACP methyl ester carboxylesterase